MFLGRVSQLLYIIFDLLTVHFHVSVRKPNQSDHFGDEFELAVIRADVQVHSQNLNIRYSDAISASRYGGLLIIRR